MIRLPRQAGTGLRSPTPSMPLVHTATVAMLHDDSTRDFTILNSIPTSDPLT